MWRKRIIKITLSLFSTRFNWPRFYYGLFLTLTFCLLARLAWPSLGHAQEKEENQKKEARVELAQIYKQKGEQLALEGKYALAAPYYRQALSLARGSFTLEERMRMAFHLSWGRKYKESLKELELVLKENPANLQARLHYVRILSWMGKFKLALTAIDQILKDNPQNLEALLIKADTLRWRGDWFKAKPLYERILQRQEIFEARLGLSYIFLYNGQRQQALDNFNLLRPIYPYQQKEAKRLAIALNSQNKNALMAEAIYYHDEDKNEYLYYPLSLSFWIKQWRFDLNYRHREAKDPFRHEASREVSIFSSLKPSDYLRVSAGLGSIEYGLHSQATYLTFNWKIDFSLSLTQFGLTLAKEGLTETAQLINKKIRLINLSYYLSQPINDRFSLLANLSHRVYSDDNRANDLNLGLNYCIHVYQPVFNLGSRLRYLSFKRQTYSGYFDPTIYLSPQLYTTFFIESLQNYLYFEAYAGYQAYQRFDRNINNWIAGVSISYGWRPSTHFLLAINATTGNFALATPTGWRYYLLTLRLFIAL